MSFSEVLIISKMNQDPNTFQIKDNDIFMLMGKAEDAKKIEAPKEKIVFEEDLTPEQRAIILKEKAGQVLTVGIENLGNTCYLNSTLQCLSRINEFREFVMKYEG